MSTSLTPTGSGPLTKLRAEVDAARAFAKLQHAPATRRAYRSDWTEFDAWCQSRGLTSLPATPEVVATFLASEASRGVKVATLGRRVAAIRYVHRAAGHEPPTKSETVSATLRGIRRTAGVAPEQKSPATAERLLKMVQHVPDGLKGLRDRALLLVGFAGAFRRSEIVAIEVEDLEEVSDGMRINVRRSKTDQEGAGYVVPILRGEQACPVAALDRWRQASGIATGPVFRRVTKGGHVGKQRLSTYSVALIVKEYATLAGYDPREFAGHSLRSGFATSAVSKGASLFRVMDITRHKSTDTLKGYVRQAEEFRNHAAKGLL